MFALRPPKRSSDLDPECPSITPNILPCRIHHDGPVEISTRYWDPVFDMNNPANADVYNIQSLQPHTFAAGNSEAEELLFRRDIKSNSSKNLWGKLSGVLASQTDRILESQTSKSGINRDNNHDRTRGNFNEDGNVEEEEEEEEEDDDDDDEPVTTILEKEGTFSEFVVWNHQKVPAADDPFVKGVSEWIQFAEAVHHELLLSMEFTSFWHKEVFDHFANFERGAQMHLTPSDESQKGPEETRGEKDESKS
ncbi:hypothetical protein ACO22_00694 [Paracoccidioides brasiliensis]|uniref:Uncharacterized protein n=1 Tax=Paracoccidioides brasiliensis TaxID=121759 RepID=A0A1D2JNP6_PARBR|nr:hypothetical protein ACO22_00694 [Paracoccidioides brasiliensis]